MNAKIKIIGSALAICVITTGCASSGDLIATTFPASRNDVFTEATAQEAQVGKAMMALEFSVKRNSYYFAGITGKNVDQPYLVHMNIDGQTAVLQTEPVIEDISVTNPKKPESGTGWKYKFSKRVVLEPGKHTVTITLPVDNVIVKRDIDLGPGRNTLTVTPVYKKRILRPYKGENFTAGVETVVIQVN